MTQNTADKKKNASSMSHERERKKRKTNNNGAERDIYEGDEDVDWNWHDCEYLMEDANVFLVDALLHFRLTKHDGLQE